MALFPHAYRPISPGFDIMISQISFPDVMQDVNMFSLSFLFVQINIRFF